jgi:putative photosynthetic complex assembly protein
MSDPFEGRPFPRGVLIGAAALIVFVIAAAAMVRMTGVGMTELPPAPVAEARELVFLDQGDGRTLAVVPAHGDVAEDGVVAELESGVDGFVLGVMRGMRRERKVRHISFDEPYLLALRTDGRLVFEDPKTGAEIDLRAFGPDNLASFAKLLRAEPKPLDQFTPAPDGH